MNADGSKMKIIIGSQISSEGVDLRFVRETHVIDSWFHLNKTEQIIGRAIRFLSHCALPTEKRNNTVYLYVAVLPDSSRETADLYSYRIGFKKAVLVGRVTRIMKQSAIDCNLNRNAIVISNQDPITEIDSQGQVRENVNINDMPFTAICDWIETCEYGCKPSIDIEATDDSTYDEFMINYNLLYDDYKDVIDNYENNKINIEKKDYLKSPHFTLHIIKNRNTTDSIIAQVKWKYSIDNKIKKLALHINNLYSFGNIE